MQIPVVALDTAIKCGATISFRQIGSKATMAGLNSLAKDIDGATRSKSVLIVWLEIEIRTKLRSSKYNNFKYQKDSI